MEKVTKRRGAVGHYGAVIACVDGKWLPATVKLAKSIWGKSAIDLHSRPGSVRRFLPSGCAMTEEMVSNLAFVSCGLHAVKDILVVKHWDCGDHGGSPSFSSPEEELEKYLGDLRRIKGFLPDKINKAVTEIMAMEPPQSVATNLQNLLQGSLNIRYAVLCPKNLNVPSPQPEDCYPLMFE